MRGSKAGFGDLKRLREQALARKAEQAPPPGANSAASSSPKGAPKGALSPRGGPAGEVLPPRHADSVGYLPPQGALSPRGGPAAKGPASSPVDDLQAFEQAMRAVAPLRTGARVVHDHRADSGEIHAQRRAAALGETARRADAGVSDGDVTHLLSEGGTAYVRADAAPDTARKLRRGQWQAGAELDLHGLRVEQARHALLSFIDECLEHGIRCVRVVHGKGYGSEGLTPVLKDKARTWLVQKKEVIAFSEASEREGGAGALVVLLRQAEEARR